jgi:hypothetical protein
LQEANLERDMGCYTDFLDEVPSASQLLCRSKIYGELLSVHQSGVGRRIFMENIDKQDDICSCQLVQQYETGNNRNIRINRLESVINTVFHLNCRGGIVKWIQDYEDVFTEMVLFGKRLGMMMKLRSVGLYRACKTLVWLIFF